MQEFRETITRKSVRGIKLEKTTLTSDLTAFNSRKTAQNITIICKVKVGLKTSSH